MTRISSGILVPLAAVLAAAACGGGTTDPGPGPGPGPGPTGLIMSKASSSGDGQIGTPSTALANPLRVIISQAGSPQGGRVVTWAVTGGGGSVLPSSFTTGADGIATTTVTFLNGAGVMAITATSAGVSGSESFTASGTVAGPQATIQVVNDAFNPANVSVKAGGTVTFVWGGAALLHNVIPDGPNTEPESPGAPGTRNSPFLFSVTFPTIGTYRYHCNNHGSPGTGMSGTIMVVP